MKHYEPGCVGKQSTFENAFYRYEGMVSIANADHIKVDRVICIVKVDHDAVFSVHDLQMLRHEFYRIFCMIDLLFTVKPFFFRKIPQVI